MTRKVIFCLFLMAMLLLCSGAYCDDRYIYSSTSVDGDEYYIDFQSVRYERATNIVRFWDMNYVTKASRNNMISSSRDKAYKTMLQKLSYSKTYIEMDISRNTYRTMERLYYDAKGHVIYSYPPSYNWSNIVPSSIMEGLRDTVIRILRGEVSPNTRCPQSQLSPSEQQEEYNKLQEYVSWLFRQRDFPEFDAWVRLRAQQAGVSMNGLRYGLEAYVRQSGGRYSDIRAMLATWYREFYMERYGSR